jgi:hypothetical protein
MTTKVLAPSDVGISLDFMRRGIAELARDIVCAVDSPDNLAASFGLTRIQWQTLQEWPGWVQLLAEIREELGGTAGTAERARRRASIAMSEFIIQDMATIAGSPNASNRDRIAAAEIVKDVSGLSAKQQAIAAAQTGSPVGYGGPLIQIIVEGKPTINVGEAPALPPPAPILEGTVVRKGD